MIRPLALICLPLPALAEVNVVTDIAPIHSLTAQIMGDVGTPTLLLPPGANPHDFQFRPSDAQAMQDADVVVMVGPALTPWLADPVATLASDASVITLVNNTAWTPLEMREGHSHGHGDHHDDEHDHDHDHDHDEHADHAEHDDHEDHEDHDKHEDHDDHADADHHDALGIDPHGWLDPAVASLWAADIAAGLIAADPANEAAYTANLAALVAANEKLSEVIAASLADTGPLLWPHDGYQYFEVRFGIDAKGSIADVNATAPGPGRIAALQDRVADTGVTCVMSDAEINGDWVDVIGESANVKTAFIDNLGASLDPGPALYGQTLRNLATAIAACTIPG